MDIFCLSYTTMFISMRCFVWNTFYFESCNHYSCPAGGPLMDSVRRPRCKSETELIIIIIIMRSFWSFVLPVLKYCSAVWCSTADSHHKLLDRDVRSAGFLAGGVLDCNLSPSLICSKVVHAVYDLEWPNASFERSIAFAVCVGACYSWCFGCS